MHRRRLTDAAPRWEYGGTLANADHLLDVAQTFLTAATQRSLISAECGATLQGFLDELRVCVAGAG